jgi:hypothetical protein
MMSAIGYISNFYKRSLGVKGNPTEWGFFWMINAIATAAIFTRGVSPTKKKTRKAGFLFSR